MRDAIQPARARESDHGARYEARREAAPVAVLAAVVLLALAAVSWREGWELHFVGWWAWVVLALPAVVLSLDLTFGPRVSFVRTQTAAEALTAVVVAGSLVGVVVLVSALVAEGGGPRRDSSCSRPRPSGSRTSPSSGCGTGSWTTAGRSSVARTSGRRRTSGFLQDADPRSPGRVDAEVWDYLYVSVTNSSAFSPTDEMPLTVHAKLLMGTQSVISLVLVVLVDRAGRQRARPEVGRGTRGAGTSTPR